MALPKRVAVVGSELRGLLSVQARTEAGVVPPSAAGFSCLRRCFKRISLADQNKRIDSMGIPRWFTHLRTEAQGEEANHLLITGTDEPGVALPGGGPGKMYELPIGKLSELIATLNEKFGVNLNDADKIWFEQQKQAVKDDETLRVVALNNDRA
jgi:hypothetical protein